MNKLRIVDSGVAQLTKRDKVAYLHADMTVHANNQDRYVYDVEHGIFAVADGVGGEESGDAAAQAACDTFHDERRMPCDIDVRDVDMLRIVQTGLLQTIHAAAQHTGGYSTFTGIYHTYANRVAYLHAGDSSLLMYRQDEIHRITSLHHHPYHLHQLTNYIGGEYEMGPLRMAPQAGAQFNGLTEWGFIEIEDGDLLILATDGVTSLSGGRELLDIQWREYLQKRTRVLGAQAIANGLVRVSDRPDDATAIVLKFEVKPGA